MVGPGSPPIVVDSHQHFWQPGPGRYPWLAPPAMDEIRRPFDVDDLAPHLARHGVDGTVLVQADDSDRDTDDMFAIAERRREVFGVVAYLPLERAEDAADRLDRLRGHPKLVGVRSLIHDRPDPDWLRRPDVAEGLALLEGSGLPFDLVTSLPRHLEHVDYLSEHFPRLRIVIDHLGKPPVGTPAGDPWVSTFRRAAANPLVTAKVSGLYPVVGPWPDHGPDDLRPYVDVALDAFGPDRLMLGSDWPVSVLAGGYDHVWGNLLQLVRGYGDEVATALVGGTAIRWYGLAAGPAEQP